MKKIITVLMTLFVAILLGCNKGELPAPGTMGATHSPISENNVRPGFTSIAPAEEHRGGGHEEWEDREEWEDYEEWEEWEDYTW